jgi:hypothetical protein
MKKRFDKMSFQQSTMFVFEKRLVVQDGLYILSIKIPNKVRHYEYQAFGDEGHQYMAEVIVGGVYKKDDKKIAQNYIYITMESMQDLFFQVKIHMEDGQILHYHEFVDIGELYKEIKPIVPPPQNVKMTVKEVIKVESEDVEDDEEDEEEEEDEESENLK